MHLHRSKISNLWITHLCKRKLSYFEKSIEKIPEHFEKTGIQFNSYGNSALSKNGSKLAVRFEKGLCVFDLPSENLVWQDSTVAKGVYNHLNWSESGSILGSIHNDQVVYYDAKTGNSIAQLKKFDGARQIAFPPNEGIAIIASESSINIIKTPDIQS